MSVGTPIHACLFHATSSPRLVQVRMNSGSEERVAAWSGRQRGAGGSVERAAARSGWQRGAGGSEERVGVNIRSGLVCIAKLTHPLNPIVAISVKSPVFPPRLPYFR